MKSIRALLPGVLEVDDVKTPVACTVLMEIGSIQLSILIAEATIAS